MTETKRQIVYMKSKAGFADRLRCLSHCVLYCAMNKAILCVDWMDDIWGMEFHELFTFLGPHIEKRQDVWKMVKEGATLYPPCWTLKDLVLPLNITTTQPEYNGLTNEKYALEFKDDFPRLPGDVIVTNGLGAFRYNIEYVSKYLRLKPEVCREIVPRLEVFKTPSVMVHLRGTDRSKNTDYDKLEKEFRSSLPYIPDVPIYIISDSVDLVMEWLKLFPKCKVFRPDACVFKIEPNVHGSHEYSAKELAKIGVTKRQFNIESLIDFFALASATAAFGRKESYYFDTARIIGREQLIGRFFTCTRPSQSTPSGQPSCPDSSETKEEQTQPCAPGPHPAHAHPPTECPAP